MSEEEVRRAPTGRSLKRDKTSLPVIGVAKDGGGKHHHKLGMFKGVLVPTCENMWGVIIFLRFYTIVGYAGLGHTIVIVTVSFMVALLTALALSAIATCGTSHNLAGVYPMLARALGKEVATATGIIYFLGIVCLAVLECLGACEEFFIVLPELASYTARFWGFVFLTALTAFVGGGIQLVSKLGLAFFAVVIATLVLLYVSLIGAPSLTAVDQPSHDDAGHRRMLAGGGGPIDPNATLIFPTGLQGQNFIDNFPSAYSSKYGFSDCLAIFFPCFTGILSGANRAGSLHDPVTAIPRGTLGAICLSYVMYMSLLALWAGVGSRAYLQMGHGQFNTIFYPSVLMGQWGIIISSLGQALQCMVVAPRLLSAIAASGTLRFLNPFAVLTAGEPKRALMLTYLIGSCIVMLGALDLVAPLLSMCFLLCYACMNLNSFFLDFLKDPHWRPKWKYFHWSVGLFGFLLCTTVMFLIQPIYAIVAWAMCLSLLGYILQSNVTQDYGSALTGFRFQVAIRSLLSIDMTAHLDKNWKPQLLLLYTLREVEDQEQLADIEQGAVGNGEKGDAAGHTHEHMFAVAQQLRHGTGLVIAAAIMQLGEGQQTHDLAPVLAGKEEEKVMHALMKDTGVQGFAMAVLTQDPTEGKAYAIQCAGLGPLSPNTVLMGWPWWWQTAPEKYVPEFISTMHQATLRQKALLVCHNVKDFPTNDEPQAGFIDVWWIKQDGGLLILMSHLLQKHRVWRRCAVRLHLITEVGTDPQLLKERVNKLLQRINISISVEEVIQIDTDSILPYLNNSTQRERNEHIVAQQLRGGDGRLSPSSTDDGNGSTHAGGNGSVHAGLNASTRLSAHFASAAASSSSASSSSSGPAAALSLPPALETDRPWTVEVSDPLSEDEDEREEDSPGNTIAATAAQRIELVDTTQDGLPDTLAVDTVGDGIADTMIRLHSSSDLTALAGSGDINEAVNKVAKRIELVDTTQDGVPDTLAIDTVGDGVADTLIKLADAVPAASSLSPAPAAIVVTTDAEQEEQAAPSKARRWSLSGVWANRSRDMLPQMPPRSNSKTNSPLAKPAEDPSAGGDGGVGPSAGGAAASATSGGRWSLRLLGGADKKDKSGAAAEPSKGATEEVPGELSLEDMINSVQTPLKKDLSAFIEKYGLAADAADELSEIFAASGKKLAAQMKTSEQAYRWDELHEIICKNSANTSLVILNLPDPPDLTLNDHGLSPDEQMASLLEYMNYMEGLASDLPRVLYVHGSGQEIINFEH